GYNSISFEDYAVFNGINVSLYDGKVYDDGFGSVDTIQNIQEVVGSNLSDFIFGDQQDNVLRGRDGDDHLFGDYGNDILIGDAGNDNLFASDGDDQILLGAGHDANVGANGVDTLTVSWENDAFEGIEVDLEAGTVTKDGYGSALEVASGFENVVGGEFNDLASGNGVANSLWGNGGDDVLAGHDGDDFLDGGEGNDALAGGAGFDSLTGGGGADSFVLTNTGADSDGVSDYIYADGDVIDLSDLLDGGLVNLSNFGDFVQVGAVDINVDADGFANGQAFSLAATLDGVSVSGQIAFNVDGTVYTYDNGAVA
ncbi:MAG TPA: calcium-binding protein, partial [Burkholderiales bacterium]|nr:calcium-binding protein [Burkholderiales bacterium]